MTTKTYSALATIALCLAFASVARADCPAGFSASPLDWDKCTQVGADGDVVVVNQSEQGQDLGVTHTQRGSGEGSLSWDSYFAASLEQAQRAQEKNGGQLLVVCKDRSWAAVQDGGTPCEASGVDFYQVNTDPVDGSKSQNPCPSGFEFKDNGCTKAENGRTTTYSLDAAETGLVAVHETEGDAAWDFYTVTLESAAVAGAIVGAKGSSDHDVFWYGIGEDSKAYLLNRDGTIAERDAQGKPQDTGVKIGSYQVWVMPKAAGAGQAPPTQTAGTPATGPCAAHPEFTFDPATGLCTLSAQGNVSTYNPDTGKARSDGAGVVHVVTTNPDGSTSRRIEYYAPDKAAALAILKEIQDRKGGHEAKIWVSGPNGLLGELRADGKVYTEDGEVLLASRLDIRGYQVNETWKDAAGTPTPAGTPPVVTPSTTAKTQAGFCDPKAVYNVPSAQCVSKPQVTSCGNDPLGGTGNGTGMGPFGGAACCDDSVCMTGFQCVFTRSSQTASEVRGQCQARSSGAWNDPMGIGRACSADDGCLSKYCNPRLGICATRPLPQDRNPLVKGAYGMACENSGQCYPGLQCGPDKFCQWAAPLQRPGVEGKQSGKCGSDKDCPTGYCNSITMTCGAATSSCTRNEDCDQARGMRCMQFSCQQDLKTKTELKITGGTLKDEQGNPLAYCGTTGQDDCYKAGIAGKQCYMNVCRNYDFEIGLSPAQQKIQDAYARIRGSGLTAAALVASANPMGMCPGVAPVGGELKGTTGDPKKDKELVEACGAGSPEAGDLVAAEAMRVGKLLGISGIKCARQVSGGGPFAWYVVNCDIPGCTDAFTRNGGDDNARVLLGRFVDGSGFKDPGNCNLTARR